MNKLQKMYLLKGNHLIDSFDSFLWMQEDEDPVL